MQALFLRRAGCAHCDRAEAFLSRHFFPLRVVEDGLDESLLADPPDVLFAFRSRIIVRKPFLDAIPLCINFHPGPPERRGSGCVNFALIEGDPTYGVTCHHMTEEIDAGPIIDVRRFPIAARDNVRSVLPITYDYMLCQLYDVARAISERRDPGLSGDEWQGPVGTIRQMNGLREISLAPDAKEHLERQIRATAFGPYQPYITLHGERFVREAG